MNKFLITFIRAGAGHESAAKAICAEILEQNPLVKIELLDLTNYSPKWLQPAFTKGYPFLIEKLPWVWAFLVILWRQKWFTQICYNVFSFSYKEFLKQKIQEFQPTTVISTYYFSNSIVRELKENSEIDQLKNYCVVTDLFTPHPIWFFDKYMDYVVFSEKAKAVGVKAGVRVENIKNFGFFFNKKFNTLESVQNQAFDLIKCGLIQAPTLLLFGGGEGLPKAKIILKELLKLEQGLNILVVCGRNEGLKNSLEKFIKSPENSNYLKNKHIQIFGFTENIKEIIQLSDIVISKAGPASVLEVLSQKKPMIISYYIWEQELGNLEFILDNNLGFYEKKPKKLANLVTKILQNPELLKTIQTNLNQLNIKSNIQNLIRFFLE